MKASP